MRLRPSATDRADEPVSWFQKLRPSRIRTENAASGKSRGIPEGLWTKCNACGTVLYRDELDCSLGVCPKCGHHMRVSARRRLDQFLDLEPREEIGADIRPTDPLRFRDTRHYRERLSAARKSTGETDALVVMRGRVHRLPVVAAAFEFAFLGGSMGSVVGERFVRAAHESLDHGTPLVCFAASGGARMQEGLFSLFQMAKTSAALARLREAGVPYVSVLTDPTTGGVSASLAMLGDVNIAEPNALIGFAGPRVIEQTVCETLPDGFQRSEFLLEHGVVDMIVHRTDLRERIASILDLLAGGSNPVELAI